MTRTPTATAPRFRLAAPFAGVLAAVAALGLSACGIIGEDTPPPPCPEIAVLRDAASVTQFVDGPGRDLIDVVVEEKVVDASGACEYDVDDDTGEGTLGIEMVVSFELNRGPANHDRRADVGYFVAITDGEQNILNRQGFSGEVTFPGNRNRLIWTDEPVYMEIPLKAKQTGRDFRVIIGLELSPDELQYNRQQIENRSGAGAPGG